MKFLCKIGMHSWCTYKVGRITVAGFCSEAPVNKVCRRCGDRENLTVVMIANEPSVSKDSDRYEEYMAKCRR